MCLIFHMRLFGDGLTVDFNVVCEKGVLCLLGGVVSVALIGEILFCVVVGSFSTISSFRKRDGVFMSCCVKFLVSLRISCVLMKNEFKLLLLVLPLNFLL